MSQFTVSQYHTHTHTHSHTYLHMQTQWVMQGYTGFHTWNSWDTSRRPFYVGKMDTLCKEIKELSHHHKSMTAGFELPGL